ncbi:hypothetical protein EDB92DRAFT_1942811 [Lactarius akahatsu]|uniref:BTB domain-containing protein n=1 Tax=Lactarius akahatsu TaxID=416441 RepID=A0AAD4LKL3_9AGAM|nr:hypothetical protein EDB92DRAFT_1942811 [Lactarius akahatsu]
MSPVPSPSSRLTRLDFGDSCEIRVPELYTSKFSPVLGAPIRDAFNSTIPANADASLQAVQLPESGAIFISLLSFVFPLSPTLPPTSAIEVTMELLSAAQKYEMSTVLTYIRLCLTQRDPPFIRDDNAFHVYSLAQKYGLRQEAVNAAQLTSNLSNFVFSTWTTSTRASTLSSTRAPALRRFGSLVPDRGSVPCLRFKIHPFLVKLYGHWKIREIGLTYLLPVISPEAAEQAPRVFPHGCTTFLGKKWVARHGHSKVHGKIHGPSDIRTKYMLALQKHVTTDRCAFCQGVHALEGEKYITELERALTQTWNKTTLEFS